MHVQRSAICNTITYGEGESEVGRECYALLEAFLLRYNNVFVCSSCRVIVTRLVSAAGTGFYYTIKKPRLRERMTLRKYDPVGMLILALHSQ